MLKSSCMKFRDSFHTETGIDPFRSCTIAGACMHVFRTYHLKEKTIARVPPTAYISMRNYTNKSIGWITYCEKITGVRYKHAWSWGEMYLKDAKLWSDAYYKSGHHKWVGAFLGCMYHGHATCYDQQTFNTMLNKSMGDMYRETKIWIELVKSCSNMYSIMWECQWDKICKTDVVVRGHLDNYSLADVLNPRDALYGGRCATFALLDQSTDRSLIKYVDVQSLYPYVCKSKHYPVGHPRCLIGPNLRGLDVNSYEGLIKCKFLQPRGQRIPLLPCHNNKKLMFLMCGACADSKKLFLTGSWVSVELQKAVAIGYVIIAIYESWKYDETTVYEQATSEGGLFARYMNTFMKIKMDASGYVKGMYNPLLSEFVGGITDELCGSDNTEYMSNEPKNRRR